jgi:hypothetical protein
VFLKGLKSGSGWVAVHGGRGEAGVLVGVGS